MSNFLPSSNKRSATLPDGRPFSLEQAWELFVAHVKTQAGRITPARRRVFEAVFARHDHFQADELAAVLCRGQAGISRATVYNTLALLVETGMVQAVRDSDVHTHYEHIAGHPEHDHMICDRCGAFLEFHDDRINAILAELSQRQRFRPRCHQIALLGTCAKCDSLRN